MSFEIMNAVEKRLTELFPSYQIYREEMGQAAEKPCFYVTLSECVKKPLLGRRYFLKNEILIQYVPKEPSGRELNGMLDLLMDGMEYISLEDGNLLRGTVKSIKEKEGTLHFLVSYNMFLLREEQKEFCMDTLSVSETIMKGE